MLKGKGVRAAADGITPRCFELLVHFGKTPIRISNAVTFVGSVDILAEELAKKEKRSLIPPKPRDSGWHERKRRRRTG